MLGVTSCENALLVVFKEDLEGGYKCQLSVKISASCQLNFKLFVSCQLNGY